LEPWDFVLLPTKQARFIGVCLGRGAGGGRHDSQTIWSDHGEPNVVVSKANARERSRGFDRIFKVARERARPARDAIAMTTRDAIAMTTGR